MEYENILENLSVMSKSVHGVKHLRDFILTKALDGSFSETKPESWRKSSLGDEVEIIRGITFPSSAKSREHADGRIVCLRTTNVQEELNWNDLLYVPESYVKNKDQYVRKNDILISMANSRELVGKVSLVTRDDIRCTLGGFIAALRCSDAVLPEFLMILLRTPSTKERMIDSSTQTTNIANISLGRLRPLEICLPSLDEQLEIIAKVSELFAKCDQLELSLAKIHMLSDLARKSSIDAISTAQTTKEMEIAWGRIHQNWDLLVSSPEAIETMRILILDLAVRGDLVKVDTLKANKIVDWKTSEMKLDDSKLWHLPTLLNKTKSGWNRVPLAKIGLWGSGGTPTSSRKDYYQNGTIPWAVIGDLNNEMMTTTEARITEKALSESSSKKVPVGAILIAMYGASIGKTAITGIECCTNQAIAHCIVDPNLVTEDYFFIVAKSLKRHLIQQGKGAAQPNISQTVLKHLIIDLPQLEEQNLIVEKVKELMQFCDKLEISIRKSATLEQKYYRSAIAASA